jgi:hypothetical protein
MFASNAGTSDQQRGGLWPDGLYRSDLHDDARARELDNTLLPMMALVVLVAAIIPLYRRLEKRWDARCPC